MERESSATRAPLETHVKTERISPATDSWPYHCARIVVAPLGRAPSRNHHEVEVWTVVAGQGTLCLDGSDTRIASGDIIYIPPLARHHVVNTSSTDPLIVQTSWFTSMDELRKENRERLVVRGHLRARHTVVIPAVLTPNGVMHLGHLAGPYIAGDVLARAARQEGATAEVILGTLGHQEHIAVAAHKAGRSYYDLAEGNTREIQLTMSAFGLQWDAFLRATPTDEYRALLAAIFKTLRERGDIVEKQTSTWFNPTLGRFRAEAFIRGRCPYCGSEASGNDCEGCGRYHDDSQLTDARDATTGEPLEARLVRRLFFRMETVREPLGSYLLSAELPAQVRQYAAWLLTMPLPDVAVTHFTSAGVDVPETGFDGQRLFAAFEHAARYLEGLRHLAIRRGMPNGWQDMLKNDPPELAILFGTDNAFPRILLTPALLIAYLGDSWRPSAMVMNHFYLLKGTKFSTGQNHAVWGNDALAAHTADVSRFYICLTRPETERTDFTEEALAKWEQEVLLGRWREWLHGVQNHVDSVSGGKVPQPGAWRLEDQILFDDIVRTVNVVRRSYWAERFSPRRAAAELSHFAEISFQYSRAVTPWPSSVPQDEYARTRVALELLTLKAFGILISPLMPSVGRDLLTTLGYEYAEKPRFDDCLEWLRYGATIQDLPLVVLRAVRPTTR